MTYSEKKKNQLLTIFKIILMVVCIIYRIIMLCYNSYFYIPYGSNLETHFSLSSKDKFDLNMNIYETYFYIVSFISLHFFHI